MIPQIACSFDKMYSSSQTVAITNSNGCTESYAFSADMTKTINTAFNNIVIDCTNPNNNIRVIDSSALNSYAYCNNNTGNSFTFSAPRQQYVAIQRYGTVTANLAITFT